MYEPHSRKVLVPRHHVILSMDGDPPRPPRRIRTRELVRTPDRRGPFARRADRCSCHGGGTRNPSGYRDHRERFECHSPERAPSRSVAARSPGGIRSLRHTVVWILAGRSVRLRGRQPGFLMRDGAHEARTGRYLLHGDPTDYESLLPALGSRTALVSIHGDRMIPAQAVDALAHRLPPTTTTRMHLVGGASDHFLWARRDPGRIVDPIEAWLRPD